jgi:hypothetical protein
MGTLSSLAVLAALLSFVAVGGAVDAAVEYDTSTDLATAGADWNASDATKYWGPWTPARATWYGQPEGAGPDDNGENPPTFPLPFSQLKDERMDLPVLARAMPLTLLHLLSCRRRVRLQAREPLPVHVHGLLRQPAAVQGRQGMRLMLQGKEKYFPPTESNNSL